MGMEQAFHIVEPFKGGVMSKSELATGTQAVDRASALLVNILESKAPLPLMVLSKTHGLPKSTASRILSALERQGLVTRDNSSGAFLAGHILTAFAREQNQDSILITRMRSVLEKLSQKTGETANLAIPGNGYISLIDQADGQFLLGTTNWIGKPVPYHASALGKILLAYSAVTIPSGRLQRLTDKTITSRVKLLEELEQVRKVGYAIINDELEIGLVAVAGPIRELDGRVIGAISISGPTSRLTLKTLREIGELILYEIESVQNKSLLDKTQKQRKVGAA